MLHSRKSPVTRHLPARTLALLAALPVLSHAQAAQCPEVIAAAHALEQKVVAWRRDFHPHPELSLHEERTAAKVTGHLRALGLRPVGLGGHGVVAIINGGKPGPKAAGPSTVP